MSACKLYASRIRIVFSKYAEELLGVTHGNKSVLCT